MNERRTILRRLVMAGAALAATGAGVAVAEDAAPKRVGLAGRILNYVDRMDGQLRELIGELQQRLNRLTSRVDNLEQTTEEEVTQLRVDNPDGPNRILFGPTDDCSIGTDPGGPNDPNGGLLLRDPSGVRLLTQTLDDGGLGLPADEASGPPTLFFGPTDECRILVGPFGQELGAGLIFEDPNGVLVRSSKPGEGSSVAIGAGECRIRAGGFVDDNGSQLLGMIFEDPEGFLFNESVDVNGNITADSFTQISSGQFKENVRPIDDALDKIKALQGVYFDWTAEKGGQADVGFIGEAVEGVLPQVVATREGETGVVGVAYGNLVAVAVEGIKAQQTELERLQQANSDLRDEMQALRERLEAMS